MVLGTIVKEGIRFGARYFPKTIQALKRTDVRIHKSLYGASGGRGVRHGRDIGATIGGLYSGFTQGDDLEYGTDEPSIVSPPYKQFKTRDRFRYSSKFRRDKYRRYCRPNRQSKY